MPQPSNLRCGFRRIFPIDTGSMSVPRIRRVQRPIVLPSRGRKPRAGTLQFLPPLPIFKFRISNPIAPNPLPPFNLQFLPSSRHFRPFSVIYFTSSPIPCYPFSMLALFTQRRQGSLEVVRTCHPGQRSADFVGVDLQVRALRLFRDPSPPTQTQSLAGSDSLFHH